MEKTFYFIDGIQPDRTSKKLMRHHVMKGKNAGRKLQRASRAGLPIHSHQPKSISFGHVNRRPDASERSVAPSTIDKLFGDAILVSSLPVAEVNHYSLQTINQFFALTTERLYPITLGFSVHEARLSWLQLLFTDEAAYHCNISLMQACNEIYIGNGSSTTKALYHLSQTFKQVQRRLESQYFLSDSTIGLVLFLIMQEQIRSQGPAAEVHAKGLKRMVELRGGLNQLGGNRSLLLKVCKTDIMLSLQNGTPTMFFQDYMADVWAKLASRGYHVHRPPVIPRNTLDPYLRSIFSDIMVICHLMNSRPSQPILDLLGFEELYVAICYRLLRSAPMKNPTAQVDSQTACQLGLLIFTMTTFFQLGRNRIIDFKVLSLRFQDFLNSDLGEVEDNISLWLMTVGAIWYWNDVDNDSVASRLRQLVQQRGIGSWHELRGCLYEFPWIQAVHDQPGQKLWNQIQKSL